MNSSTSKKIDIIPVEESRVTGFDFNNIVFGQVYTDHMFECDWVDGEWINPTIKPYGNLSISPAAKVFHYGQAIFEGMKAYKDKDGRVWLFRPEENFVRFNKSCKRLAMPEFPRELFFEALTTLVAMDQAWIPTEFGDSLYIRPFAIATQPNVGATPSTKYKVMFIMSPAKIFYSTAIPVKIAEHYSRASDGGVGAAKAAGNYAAQFYPTNLAREKGFIQMIWTDSNTHEYLEEAGTMNVFFRVNDTLLTAPISDRILDGVTRKSVIDLAKRSNIEVEIRPVKVSEIVAAAEDGSLKEIFGSGTAAVISPFNAFSYKEKRYELPEQDDSYSEKFKKELMEIQQNIAEDPFGWRYEVKK